MYMNRFIVSGAFLIATAGALAQSHSHPHPAGSHEDVRAKVCLDAQCQESNRFFVRSGDSSLNIGGDLQFRYTFDTKRTDPESDSDSERGFNIPLAKLRFSGKLDSTVDFMFEPGFTRTGESALYNAYAGLTVGEGSRFQVGQFKLPFLHEDSVEDRYQLAADRSVMSYVFGQGYSQGVQFSYSADEVRLFAAFSDGFNTANTEYTDPSESDNAITLRGEFTFFGENNSYNDFTSAMNQNDSMVGGVAFHYQDGTTQDAMYTYTADLAYESNGFNVFAAGVGRNIEEANNSFDDFGASVQAGYRVNDIIEPFARYDVVFSDEGRGLSNDNFNFLTAGLNYYVIGHSAKFTTDVVWSMDETSDFGSLGNFSNTGLLGSDGEKELAFRAQFQVSF